MSSIISNISAKLPHLCKHYRTQLQIADKNHIEIKNVLLGLYGSRYSCTNQTTIESAPDWVPVLARMDPLKFMNHNKFMGTDITYDWLLDQHDKQMEFYSKTKSTIDPLVLEEGSEDMKILLMNYDIFLNLCRKYPKVIVPSLIEDFVWHSHMIDHESYVTDTIKIFGKLLLHRNDIDSKSYEKKSNHYRKQYYNQLSENKTKSLDKNNASKDIQKRDDDIMDLWNPLNPVNLINPLSPYYHIYHSKYDDVVIAPASSSCSSYSSSSSYSNSSYSSSSNSSCSSSSSSSSCGSSSGSSCGSSCGGGGGGGGD